MISPLNLEVSVTGETFLLQVDVTYVIDDDCPKAIYTDKTAFDFLNHQSPLQRLQVHSRRFNHVLVQIRRNDRPVLSNHLRHRSAD